MNLQELKQLLLEHGDGEVLLQFSSGQILAPHFHVTEVGKVSKDFVDCGGTRRTTDACVLQTYVANDADHRLSAAKLAQILGKAAVLALDESWPVEVEVQSDTIAVYLISSHSTEDGKLRLGLRVKRTACLDPQKCGLEVLSVVDTSAGDSGCCDDTDCC